MVSRTEEAHKHQGSDSQQFTVPCICQDGYAPALGASRTKCSRTQTSARANRDLCLADKMFFRKHTPKFHVNIMQSIFKFP